MVGGPQYAQALQTAAKQTDALARAEKTRAANTDALTGALGDLGVANALLVGGLGAVVLGVREAIKNFQEDEDAIFRTTILLRNLGNSYPIEKATAFAAAQQQATGFQDDVIVGMLGTLKAAGAVDSQIEALGKTILDFSAGKGIPLEEVTRAVSQALLGNTRSLRSMQIQMKATGDRVKDTTTLMKLFNQQTAGAATARLGTLTGQFDRLRAAMSEFFSVIGDKISVVLVPALDKLSSVLFALAKNPALSGALFFGTLGALLGARGGPAGAGIGGAIGALLGLGLGLLPSRANAANAIGGRTPEQKLLDDIANNTGKMAGQMDAVLRLGFGNGTVGLRAGNTRAFRAALRGAI